MLGDDLFKSRCFSVSQSFKELIFGAWADIECSGRSSFFQVRMPAECDLLSVAHSAPPSAPIRAGSSQARVRTGFPDRRRFRHQPVFVCSHQIIAIAPLRPFDGHLMTKSLARVAIFRYSCGSGISAGLRGGPPAPHLTLRGDPSACLTTFLVVAKFAVSAIIHQIERT